MGTSSSYGGTNRSGWKEARQAAERAFTRTESIPPIHPRGGQDPTESQPVSPDILSLLRGIGRGLRSDDAELRNPPTPVPMARIVAGLAGAAIAGGLPSVGRAEITAPGTRPVLLGARRAGAAVGAGLAIRSGNRNALTEVGLRLEDLENLAPMEKVSRIIDFIFGASSDESQHAFREVACALLLRILEAPDENINYTTLVQDAVTEMIYQRALVELGSQIRGGNLSPEEAAVIEAKIKLFIRDLVRAESNLQTADQFPTPTVCADTMARGTSLVIAVLNDLGGGGENPDSQDRVASTG